MYGYGYGYGDRGMSAFFTACIIIGLLIAGFFFQAYTVGYLALDKDKKQKYGYFGLVKALEHDFDHGSSDVKDIPAILRYSGFGVIAGLAIAAIPIMFAAGMSRGR